MKLVFANIDYRTHMTDEGEQLQAGLAAAGWTLVGQGYGDGLRAVPALVARYQPSVIVVQDKRDWDPMNAGSFRKDLGFAGLGYLRQRPDIKKLVVVKDAGTLVGYHHGFAEESGAMAILTYYHRDSVVRVAPWMGAYHHVRTYHTIDADLVRRLAAFDRPVKRRRGVVSGALNPKVYPVRSRVFAAANRLKLDSIPHPGYSNKQRSTNKYLGSIGAYKVHVATCSAYRFALRKIIESVAMGATPVTNLPAYDRLPMIDEALVRISENASNEEVYEAVNMAERNWDHDRAVAMAERALEFYDYRAMGRQLDFQIESMMVGVA